jgi:hypothetical protein
MSQDSMSWSELADLTHATQVEKFNFCLCEEQEQFPYADCPRSCEDCNAKVTYTLEPYGSTYMAVITCHNCGTSYDTNLDPSDYEGAK